MTRRKEKIPAQALSHGAEDGDWNIICSAKPQYGGSFHVYLETAGRKIAAIWGPPEKKIRRAAVMALAPDGLKLAGYVVEYFHGETIQSLRGKHCLQAAYLLKMAQDIVAAVNRQEKDYETR